MSNVRPSEEELTYVGFEEWQRILLRGASDSIVIDAYRIQLEMLMSGDEYEIDF